jgi:hypothetical protein
MTIAMMDSPNSSGGAALDTGFYLGGYTVDELIGIYRLRLL